MKPGPKARPFWSQVAFGRDCWEWVGGTFINGYGRVHVPGGSSIGAHRKAYELTIGDVPDGMVVMHTCDNRTCVRPDHLRVGTSADNMADMVAKGRSLRGPRNHQTKLTEDQVRDIKTMLEKGYTKAAIARKQGVSEAGVYSIAVGRTWEWVE